MIDFNNKPIKKLYPHRHTSLGESTLSIFNIFVKLLIKNKKLIKIFTNVKRTQKVINHSIVHWFHSRIYQSLPQILIKALFLMCFPALSVAASFFEEHASGWFWYQDFLEEKKLTPPSVPPKINSTDQMKAYQKQIEDSLNLAILSPSEANLKAYAKNYFEVIQKAQYFTDAYQLMLLRHPGFDYSLQFPLNPLAQQVYAEQKERSLQTAIQTFAKHQGFFFFFSPACQYCHLFAPIVKAFAEKYGIAVLAINLDPQSPNLKEFPHALPDKGASRLFKITYLPSLFVVNPKTQEIIPLANGFISLSQLEENLFRIIEVQAASPSLRGPHD